eukprot:NODE_248_length_11794_cov_0.876015.p4 type:complete len:447 gc:universal NODE_248_length_11794_cov_0.876015:5330-6670(+)
MFQYQLDEKQKDENLARALMAQEKRVHFRRNNRIAVEFEKERLELEEMIKQKELKETQMLKFKQLQDEEERVENQKRNALRHQKMRQLARENHEVRYLKSQLQELLTKKQQHVQIEQHLIEKELRQLEKEKLRVEIDHKVHDFEVDLQKEENISKEHQNWYKESLDAQLVDIELRQEQMFQEFLKEKHLIDNLVKTIQEENALFSHQKQIDKMQVRQYIKDFLAEQDKYKEKQKLLEKVENDKIKEYVAQKESKKAEDSHKRNALDEVRDKIYEQLAANIKQRDIEQKEREEIIFQVARQKQDEKEKQDIVKEFEKRTNEKIILLDSYKHHLLSKQESRKKDLDIKIKEKERLLEQLKEDKALEQLTLAAKKRRMATYHHELSLLVAYKQKMQVDLENSEKELTLKLLKIDQEKEDLIANEKKKIVAEYSTKLQIPEIELVKYINK